MKRTILHPAMTGGLLACLALGGGAAALSAQAVIFPQSQQAGEATLSEMGGGLLSCK